MSKTPTSRTSTRAFAWALRLLPATGGGTAIEYALLAALIALAIVGALGDLGSALVALPLPSLIPALGGSS